MLSSLQATGNDLPFQRYLLGFENDELEEQQEKNEKKAEVILDGFGKGVCSPTLKAEEERDRSCSPVRVRLSDYYEVDNDTVGECDTMGASPKRHNSVAGIDDKGRKQVVTPSAPKYLQQETAYDITPLMKREFVSYVKSVPILEDGAWPSNDMLCVNESQADAVRTCLTRELAIVQGPPGTGKTFISLKVAQILLLNPIAFMGQILVICYTNHALDQFLEGITSFQKTGIVRVGSRSKKEKLDKFNLNNLRSELPQYIANSAMIRWKRRSIEGSIDCVRDLSRRMGRMDWRMVIGHLSAR